MKKEIPYYVYLVLCSDDTLYCGITTEPERRIREHNARLGAKYTKGRLPVKLLYSEKLNSKSVALKREIEIKKLSRKEKIERFGLRIEAQTTGPDQASKIVWLIEIFFEPVVYLLELNGTKANRIISELRDLIGIVTNIGGKGNAVLGGIISS